MSLNIPMFQTLLRMPYMAIELDEHQLLAIEKLKNGSILCANVGAGKSRTALAYYYLKECQGKIRVNGEGSWGEMKSPRDLYIITTAKKRDSNEWLKECAPFMLTTNKDKNISNVNVVIDSWNNISKYKEVYGAFFIFDEQRVVGRGAWVKAFLNIARKNRWILLSATPGDTWSDYIPVFVANGFYKNRTEFDKRHSVYSRFAKYPKIDHYVEVSRLEKLRDSILVNMMVERSTVQHHEYISVDYSRENYRRVMRDRWDIYDNKPIKETGKLFYLLRKVVNSDPTRADEVLRLSCFHPRIIIFYNFDYELDILRRLAEEMGIVYAEWNGQKHEELPTTKQWLYFVQYSAGAEGWNCTETNAIIFYSQSYSYRMTVQASGRIDRRNTPFTDLYYYHFKSSASIDLAIAKALKSKKNFNERSFKIKI